MNENGNKILLCQASYDVCIMAFLICKMVGWLGSAVNDLIENLFVCF